MTTLIILGLPCITLGIYIYCLNSLDKERDSQNIIEKLAAEKLLPFIVVIGIIGCGFGLLGFVNFVGYSSGASNEPALRF